MISILSVGTCKPGNVLDIELSAGSAEVPLYSTLNSQYLKDTKNREVSAAIHNTVISTTELAAKAALTAIEKAGISKEQIGLLLADCSTPVEIIPGESQRIACALGLKIPAYDILSGSTSLLTFMQSLKSWKEEKLPEYILCVSVNSPTQRVEYSQGSERQFFSDGAGAVVISSVHKGKLSLQENISLSSELDKGAMQIDLYGHIKLDFQILAGNYSECLANLNETIAKRGITPLVLSDNYPGTGTDNTILKPKQGNSLGSGIFFALDANWDSLKKNDQIILFAAALESLGGAASLLKVEN